LDKNKEREGIDNCDPFFHKETFVDGILSYVIVPLEKEERFGMLKTNQSFFFVVKKAKISILLY